MGTCSLKERTINYHGLSTNDFKFKLIIGQGGFGKVWKVQRKRDSKIFAMKALSKAKIIYKDSISSVMNERRLLANLNYSYIHINNRFLVNMIGAFQDTEYLYMILDFMPGGDLRHYMKQQKIFSEAEASK